MEKHYNLKHEAEELTIDNFTNIVDDDSWKEFMPKGVTKELFNDFKQYFDKEIFTGASMRIRELVREADKMNIEERIEQITSIFSYFRNPDKETVLTPWRVVNMHMGDTIGGWNFYRKDFSEPPLVEPRFIDNGEVTQEVFSADARILEINSKSGLYPLYVAYSVYKTRRKEWEKNGKKLTHDEQQNLWYTVLKDNVFVICMTPMAEAITRRTLAGFNRVVVNAKHYPDLINEIKNNKETLISTVCQGKTFWRTNNDDNMKFNAIVGNPPYQVMDGGAGASAIPVYNHFVEITKSIHPRYFSLIMPSRWMSGGRGLDDFRSQFISDRRVRELFDFYDATVCFSNVEIKGGICYLLWEEKYIGKCNIHTTINKEVFTSFRYLKEGNDDIFIRDSRLLYIKNKISGGKMFDSIVSSMKPFGLRGDFFKSPLKYGLPLVSTSPIHNGIEIIGLDDKMQRVKRYVASDYPLPQKEGLNAFKIFVPRNYGIGQLGESPSNPIMAKPMQCCTETFVYYGPFKTKEEMEGCRKYMDTKFFRALVGIVKHDQGAGKQVYRFVPLQDFTPQSDIDWSKSIPEIDRQLYDKYNLTEEERSFIERMIKPME